MHPITAITDHLSQSPLLKCDDIHILGLCEQHEWADHFFVSLLKQQLVLGKNKIEDFRNAFVNIAIPFFTLSEPMPPAKFIMSEGKDDFYTLWDRFEIDEGRDVTMKEFLDIFKEKFKYDVTMISTGKSMIYSPFGNKKKTEERMKMPLSEVVKEVSKQEYLPKQRYLVLTVLCSDEEGEEVDVPEVRYRFKH